MKNLLLRKSVVEDIDFLREIFFEIRSAEFAMMGLPQDVLNSLLSTQYKIQEDIYNGLYPKSENFIIEFEAQKVGRFLINQEENHIHLIDISILHNFRNRGFGSILLEKLKSEANFVTLKVYKLNLDAIRLYQRKGFSLVEEDGMYQKMEWKNA